jgi:hypothetical protein
LLQWQLLRTQRDREKRYQHDQSFEGADIIKLDADSAMVEVRAGQRSSVIRGTRELLFRFDGPARLEKIDGAWRIVDFTVDGRQRLASLVVGALGEQEREGITARVVAVDRLPHATDIAVELVNDTAAEIRVDRAFTLFETHNKWARAGLVSAKNVPPHSSGTVVLGNRSVLELWEPELFVAFRVRSGSRKLPFSLKVSLEPQETVVNQRPPRRMPLLAETWPRMLVFYAALTAVGAWQYGWLAIVVPLYVGLWVYRQYRAGGLMSERLHRLRFVLDGLVVTLAFAILWEIPDPVLAVPAAVGAVVYLALKPIGKGKEGARLVVALSAGLAWFFLLGTYVGPLSPCRLAGGNPASVADSFTAAFFEGDIDRMHRYEVPWLRSPDQFVRELHPISAAAAAAAVRRRVHLRSSSSACRYELHHNGVVECYSYRSSKAVVRTALVGVTCDGRNWRVGWWE